MEGVSMGHPGYGAANSVSVPYYSESSPPVPAPATCPQSGDPAEQAYYAEQLQLGIGVERNVEEAFNWYTKAADSGHKASLLALADLYLQGVGADVDSSTKIRHLEAAGNLNHAGALNALGEIYEDEKDLVEEPSAMHWATDIVDLLSGVLFPKGWSKVPDPSSPRSWPKAFECYQRASELGCRNAYANLSRCFHEGKGTEKEEVTALVWATLAAAEGLAEGMYRAGLIHLTAKGKLADFKRAISYLEQAAKLDHAPAQYELATIHGPNGQEPDPNLAFQWASKSAATGYGPGLGRLGQCHEHGFGTQKNLARARELYQSAAELGDRGAMFLLGWMLYHGHGTPVQHEEAFHWFLEAAKRDCPTAQFCVAKCYQNSRGVLYDRFEMECWFYQARKAGVTSVKGI